jgi:hypothetical protein
MPAVAPESVAGDPAGDVAGGAVRLQASKKAKGKRKKQRRRPRNRSQLFLFPFAFFLASPSVPTGAVIERLSFFDSSAIAVNERNARRPEY